MLRSRKGIAVEMTGLESSAKEWRGPAFLQASTMERNGWDWMAVQWTGRDRKGHLSCVHKGMERSVGEWSGAERMGSDRKGHLSRIHIGPDRSGGEWSELDRRGSDGKGLAFLQASTTDRTELDRKGQERMG